MKCLHFPDSIHLYEASGTSTQLLGLLTLSSMEETQWVEILLIKGDISQLLGNLIFKFKCLLPSQQPLCYVDRWTCLTLCKV